MLAIREAQDRNPQARIGGCAIGSEPDHFALHQPNNCLSGRAGANRWAARGTVIGRDR
ncbi:MAG: hypothetical protein ABI423_13540 [Burkholderiales bacterium]